MAQKISEDQRKKFSEITKLKYGDQAKWFLNGFWESGASAEAETVWKYAQKFIEIDEKNKKEGNELDEFQAHKFLESLGETLTVVAMRDRLRQIDLDFNRRVALIEYLTVRYGKDVNQVINSPQGDNRAEIEEAQSKLDAVSRAYEEVQRQLDEQTRALSAQKKALEDSKKASEQAKKASDESRQAADVAKKALDEQKKAEDTVRKSEEELRAAVDELKRQEDAYAKQCSDLEAKSKDSGASIVARNKAANELAQLKQEDPTPLRKAKLSQEAVLRKVEKERKAAEAATAHAASLARDAEKKRDQVEEQTLKVEEAVRQTEAMVKEAEDYLEEVKKQGGVPHGAIWWMQRELKEQQKYLPKSKQRQF